MYCFRARIIDVRTGIIIVDKFTFNNSSINSGLGLDWGTGNGGMGTLDAADFNSNVFDNNTHPYQFKIGGGSQNISILSFCMTTLNADANFVRTKFSSKSTDNLCHCWNSIRYCRGRLFSNVNELALAPCKL